MDPGDQLFIDHFPQSTPNDIRIKGMRIAAWSHDREQLHGCGQYLGEDFHICMEHGTGNVALLQMDDNKTLYGCDVFWLPVSKIPMPIKEIYGIKE